MAEVAHKTSFLAHAFFLTSTFHATGDNDDGMARRLYFSRKTLTITIPPPRSRVGKSGRP